MMVLLVLLLVLSVTRCHLWVSHWVPQRRTKYLVCIGLSVSRAVRASYSQLESVGSFRGLVAPSTYHTACILLPVENSSSSLWSSANEMGRVVDTVLIVRGKAAGMVPFLEIQP